MATPDPMIPAPALFDVGGARSARAGAAVQWHISSGVGHSIDETGLALGGMLPDDGVPRDAAPPQRRNKLRRCD